ncbi:MAG: YgiT-type zinc finger protein [bacterium]
MKCHNCGSEKFEQKYIENIFRIEDKIYLVKNIPAEVCSRCDEPYFSPETYKTVRDLIDNNVRVVEKIETAVLEFA